MKKAIAILLTMVLAAMGTMAMADGLPLATPTDLIAEEPAAQETVAETAPAAEEEPTEQPEESQPAEDITAEQPAENQLPEDEMAEQPAENQQTESIPAAQPEESQPADTAAQEPEEARVGLVLREDGLYSAPGAEDCIVLPAGTNVLVLQVGEEWTLIKAETADGEMIQGYILNDSIALYNVMPKEAEKIRAIIVTTNTSKLSRLQEGMRVIISARLIGFENDVYTVQWQYSPDGGTTILDIPGATGLEYGYFLNRNNAGNIYRIVVTYEPDALLDEQ